MSGRVKRDSTTPEIRAMSVEDVEMQDLNEDQFKGLRYSLRDDIDQTVLPDTVPSSSSRFSLDVHQQQKSRHHARGRSVFQKHTSYQRYGFQSKPFKSVSGLLLLMKVAGHVPFDWCRNSAGGRMTFQAYRMFVFLMIFFRAVRAWGIDYSTGFINILPLLSLAVTVVCLLLAWIYLAIWIRKPQMAGRILTLQREIGYMLHSDDKERLISYLKDHNEYIRMLNRNHTLLTYGCVFLTLTLFNVTRYVFIFSGNDKIEDLSAHLLFDEPLYETFGPIYLIFLTATDVYTILSIPIAWAATSIFYHIFRRHMHHGGQEAFNPETKIHNFFFKDGLPVLEAYVEFRNMYSVSHHEVDAMYMEEDEIGSAPSLVQWRNVNVNYDPTNEELYELESEVECFRMDFIHRLSQLETYVRRLLIVFCTLISTPASMWAFSLVLAWILDSSAERKNANLYFGIGASVGVTVMMMLAANMLKVYRVKKFVIYMARQMRRKNEETVKMEQNQLLHVDVGHEQAISATGTGPESGGDDDVTDSETPSRQQSRVDTFQGLDYVAPDLLNMSREQQVRWGMIQDAPVKDDDMGHINPTARKSVAYFKSISLWDVLKQTAIMVVKILAVLFSVLWIFMLWRTPECVIYRVFDEGYYRYDFDEHYHNCSTASYVGVVLLRWVISPFVIFMTPFGLYTSFFSFQRIRSAHPHYHMVNAIAAFFFTAITVIIYLTVTTSVAYNLAIGLVVTLIVYGAYVTSHVVARRIQVRWYLLFTVISLVVLLMALLVLIVEVPMYIYSDPDSSTRLTIVAIVHPIIRTITLPLVLDLSHRMQNTDPSSYPLVFFVFGNVLLSLFERFFLFNLSDITSQVGAIMLLAILEILARLTAPFQRFIFYGCLFWDSKRAYRKLETHRLSDFHSHSHFITQYTELWTLLFAVIVTLVSQNVRDVESPSILQVCLSLFLQVIGEIFTNVISTTLDRVYHERGDILLWDMNYSRYFKTSLFGTVGVIGLGYGSFIAIADSYSTDMRGDV